MNDRIPFASLVPGNAVISCMPLLNILMDDVELDAAIVSVANTANGEID